MKNLVDSAMGVNRIGERPSGEGSILSTRSKEREVREWLESLGRTVQDDALEELAGDSEVQRSSKAIRLAAYRSLRKLKSCAPRLLERFAAAALSRGAAAVESDVTMAMRVLDSEDLQHDVLAGTFVAESEAAFAATVAGHADRDAALRAVAGGPRAILDAFLQALNAEPLEPEVRLVLLRSVHARLPGALVDLRMRNSESGTPHCPVGPLALAVQPHVPFCVVMLAGFRPSHPAGSSGPAMSWTREHIVRALTMLPSESARPSGFASGTPAGPATAPGHEERATLEALVAFALRRASALRAPERAMPHADREVLHLVDALVALLGADPSVPAPLRAPLRTLRVPLALAVLRHGREVLSRDSAVRLWLVSVLRVARRDLPGTTAHVRAIQNCGDAIAEIVATYDGDLAVFVESRMRLESALRSPAQPGDAATREQRLQVWTAVAVQIRAQLAHEGLPPLVHGLLRRPWAQYMAQIALRHGIDSDEFRHAAGVADGLRAAFEGWTTLPSRAPARAQEAMHLLAAIAIDLRNGLERIGYRAVQVMAVWHGLTRLIVEGSHGPLDRASASETALIGVGHDVDSALLEFAEPAPQSLPAPAALQVGDVVELRLADRPPQQLKVCWRSSATGWLIFVSKAGVKALELPASRAARMLAEGSLVRRSDA